MSSIRIFVLGSLAERGPMHGHQLRLLAEEEHVHLWTDITVGAVYGAIKRLETDQLVEYLRTEREGRYPQRQVIGITEAGLRSLSVLRDEALRAVVMKPDPFDLAMTRLDPETLAALPGVVTERVALLRQALAAHKAHNQEIDHFLTVAERTVLTHKLHRLRAEIDWHTTLLDTLPEIIANESARRDNSDV